MNKEQTKEAIKVMQAWVEGKTCQVRPENRSLPWVDLVLDPEWNWVLSNYRINSTPIEYWIVRDYDGQFFSFTVLSALDNPPMPTATRTVIKVREVLE